MISAQPFISTNTINSTTVIKQTDQCKNTSKEQLCQDALIVPYYSETLISRITICYVKGHKQSTVTHFNLQGDPDTNL